MQSTELKDTTMIELVNPADVLQRSLATTQQTFGIKMKRQLMCEKPETSCLHKLQYFYDGNLMSSGDFRLSNSYQNLTLQFHPIPAETSYEITTSVENVISKIDTRNQWFKLSDSNNRDTEAFSLKPTFTFYITFNTQNLVTAQAEAGKDETIPFFQYGGETKVVAMEARKTADDTFKISVWRQTTELTFDVATNPADNVTLEISNYQADQSQFETAIKMNGVVKDTGKAGKKLRGAKHPMRVWSYVDFELDLVDFEKDDLGSLPKTECDVDNECGAGAVCRVVDGVEVCPCENGYIRSGTQCIDIDECSTFNDCKARSTCINTEGSFTCECHTGFDTDSARLLPCENVDECQTVDEPVCPIGISDCVDTAGSYTCNCHTGYEFYLDGAKQKCRNVNECMLETHDCHQICTDTPGSFICSCKTGYFTENDGRKCEIVKVEINAAAGLDPAAADKMADENAQKQQKVFGDLKGEAERLTKIDVTELTKDPNATALLLDDLTNIVKGVESVESGKKVDETKDPTMIQLEKSMIGQINEKNAEKEKEMLAAVTNSIDVLLNVADTTGESLIGDENLAAAKTNFKNADNAEVKLPLHVIDMKVDGSKHKQKRSIQSPSLVGMKTNPYAFGEASDQPAITLRNAMDVDVMTVRTNASSPPVLVEKTITAANVEIIKLKPIRHQDMMVWIRPKNMSHAFDFYFNYGYPPHPDKLVYRHMFQLPTNTFIEPMALRKCETENDCARIDIEDPNGDFYGHPYGVHFPTKGELDFCFAKFGDKCNVMLAIKLLDIDPLATSEVIIETINIGCRTLSRGSESWSRDECDVSKESTSDTTVCTCSPTEDTFTLSTDVSVPPRSLNFASIKSADINAASIIIGSFSVALVTIYLLGVFYAQRHDRHDELTLEINDIRTSDAKGDFDRDCYLIVVDTNRTFQQYAPTHVFLQFDFDKSDSPNAFERFISNVNVQRFYSCKLQNGTQFSSSSRRYFLVSLNQIPLEYALRLKVWMNIEKSDAVWSPKCITVMKPYQPITNTPECGSLDDHFTTINEFTFSGDILSLHSEDNHLSALSANYLEYLNIKEMPMHDSYDMYYQELMAQLVNENLWISVFFKSGWSSFNRTARLTTAVLAMSLISLGNMMWYKQDSQVDAIQIGPVQFSVASIYVSLMQAIVAGVPTILFIMLFSQTAPVSIARHRAGEFWTSSSWLRPLLYIAAVLIISGSLITTVLFGLSMQLQDANVWLSGQWVSVLLDVLIIPFIKIAFSTMFFFLCCPSKINFYSSVFKLKPSSYLHKIKADPDMLIKNLIRLPEAVASSEEARMAKISGRQQQEMMASVWKLTVTVVKVVAFNVIVQSIIPNDKYLLDQGFRRQTEYFNKHKQVDDIFKIWSVLLDTGDSQWPKIPTMNFPVEHYNDEKLSAFEKQTAKDMIHFRVGPSRLFQFRHGNCTNYEANWKTQMTETPKIWQLDSPILRPWITNNDTHYPKDFDPMLRTRDIGEFETCAYEAEMGTNLETSKLILNNLNSSQWLDTNTDSIFFEQTYYNGNINSFLMFRISWEHVKGGMFQGQLRIKQLVYQNAKDSNQVFYCYLIFVANFLVEFLTLVKRCVVGPRSWSIVSYTMFIVFDVLTIYYLVMTTITINDAIVEYQLDPRSRPPFEDVYKNQHYLVNIISVSLFMRILHLVITFSVLNSIKSAFYLVQKLSKVILGWLLFMLPFTAAYSIVGVMFLSSYSPNFRKISKSVETLIIHGYLKPNDLRSEMEKSPEFTFINVFQTTYTILIATMIVNFLVALIDESNRVAKEKPKDPDFLEFISYLVKMRFRQKRTQDLSDLKILDDVQEAQHNM